MTAPQERTWRVIGGIVVIAALFIVFALVVV